MDLNSILNNPIVWIVAILVVVSFIRKAYRKLAGFVFTVLAILKFAHYLELLQ